MKLKEKLFPALMCSDLKDFAFRFESARREDKVAETRKGKNSSLYCHENNYVFLGDSLLSALIYYSNYTFSLRWQRRRRSFYALPHASCRRIMSANGRLFVGGWLAVKLRGKRVR